MASEIFVDSSGFFALLVKSDEKHHAANRIHRRAARDKQRFLTTDYVLDETATLCKARGYAHVASALFEAALESAACRVLWTESERFDSVRAFFLKHQDQAWSFTDCLSFCIMKELRLREALTKDAHFEQAGFVALLR